VAACKIADPNSNPGALLGVILGTCHNHDRDKLTIFTSPEVHDAGAWLEQLIAESTGKDDIAIIPVDREPVEAANSYGHDRIFAYLKLKETAGGAIDDTLDQLVEKGHPVIRISLADRMNLGQEFFRWEFATAVAGSIMKINTFNQPDVEAAKIEARKLTDEYEKTGKLPDESPFYEESGIRLFTDWTNEEALNESLKEDDEEPFLAAYLSAHLSRIKEGDYFALLAYVEMNTEHERILQNIREWVLKRYGVATCLGFGPRFLHSTGQAYKGGGNNGVFLQITSDDAKDLPVPEQKFTFGVVKAAQARGDFQVLTDRKRRALRVHLGPDVTTGLEKLASLISQ
jgi:transaldolase / glucose-6-phosphate isomerase